MILARSLLVLVLVFAVLLVARFYRSWQAGLRAQPAGGHRPVPASLRAGAERTWVVFTTPYCAACGPVEQRLRSVDPDAHLVRVDATREPHLAREFGVRSAPTAVLADSAGTVQAFLVGAEAVDRWILGRREAGHLG